LADKLEDFKGILNRYENKAEGLRQAHSDLYVKFKTRSDRVTIITIGLSALVTFLALTDLAKILGPFNLNAYIAKIDPFFSLLLALLGFIIFIATLLNFVLGWQDKYLKHESGVKLLTNYITNIKDISDLTAETPLSDEEIDSKIKEINEKYLMICEILPLIPDQDFLNSKQKYIIKRKISEKLNEDPCINTDIKEYLKQCKKNAKEQTTNRL
jgi:hypothetical protein